MRTIVGKWIFFLAIAGAWMPAHAEHGLARRFQRPQAQPKRISHARQLWNMLALYPQTVWGLPRVSADCALWANEVSDSNRARHLCWQAALTVLYGPEVAEGIGNIHEGSGDLTDLAELADSRLDDRNNVLGRRIGMQLRREGWGGWDTTYGALMREVKRRVLASPHTG